LQGVSLLTGQDIYVIIGTFLLFGLLTAGLVITVIAMKKYNGGVF
jgi:hypothetical protein